MPSDEDLTMLSSDGDELIEVMSVGGNSLRGPSCAKGGETCYHGYYCCGESCLLLYDDVY